MYSSNILPNGLSITPNLRTPTTGGYFIPRRVEFTKAGAPNTIRVSEMPMPEPKAGEVRIKVAFA